MKINEKDYVFRYANWEDANEAMENPDKMEELAVPPFIRDGDKIVPNKAYEEAHFEMSFMFSEKSYTRKPKAK